MAENKAKKKVLIISHDKIGTSMAGPGIRYHYMAETLSDKFDVTIGFFGPDYLPEKDFQRAYKVKHVDSHLFETGFKDIDIVIALWLSEAMIDYCNKRGIFVVFDMYVVGSVENLAGALFNDRSAWPQDDFEYDQSLAMSRRFLENGDLFLLSNQRQLDYWIGFMFGANQIHLSSYPNRPIYDRLIFAPMGIDTSLPMKRTKNVIRGVMPGIGEKDKILIWTGGIWGHFDGQVLIRAMKVLEKERPDIKLVFLGTRHPNSSVLQSKESADTYELAKKYGLLSKNVLFNDGWVDYHQRVNYLLESDVAVSTHKPSIETEFSHRTRILDHLLAALPTVSTEGDYIADVIIKPNNLGLTVPPNDPGALVEAIIQILEPERYKEIKNNLHKVRGEYDWAKTMQPLREFLINDPKKLQRLTTVPKLKSSNKAIRLAKKVTPLPVKKAVYNSLKRLK